MFCFTSSFSYCFLVPSFLGVIVLLVNCIALLVCDCAYILLCSKFIPFTIQMIIFSIMGL